MQRFRLSDLAEDPSATPESGETITAITTSMHCKLLNMRRSGFRATAARLSGWRSDRGAYLRAIAPGRTVWTEWCVQAVCCALLRCVGGGCRVVSVCRASYRTVNDNISRSNCTRKQAQSQQKHKGLFSPCGCKHTRQTPDMLRRPSLLSMHPMRVEARPIHSDCPHASGGARRRATRRYHIGCAASSSVPGGSSSPSSSELSESAA
eukprot:7376280-Prymnesium_polylepis.1